MANKKYIIITADTNDGDYVKERTLVTDAKLKKLEPIIKAIKEYEGHHNWETQDMEDDATPDILYVRTKKLTKKQVEFFEEFIPNSEYGIHTIVDIELIEVVSEKKLM